MSIKIVLFISLLLSLTRTVCGFAESEDRCPKHQALMHTAMSTYYMDLGDTVKLWAMLIPAPWEDNRLIGGLSNTTLLKFDLTSSLKPSQQKGVISRNVTATVIQKPSTERQTGEANFYIRSYAEDQSCQQMSMETKIVVGCPPYTKIKIRGKMGSGCEDYVNYTYTIDRNEIDPHENSTADKVVHYDYKRHGCPFQVPFDEPFRPTVDIYGREELRREVQGDYVVWEENGRLGYTYSATHRSAGCLAEGTTWKKALRSQQKPDYKTAWTKDNHQSCFKAPTDNSHQDLDSPYEILNNSGVLNLQWMRNGIFVFQLTVIDPTSSFCDLTTSFAVHVQGSDKVETVIPTFLVLGTSCITIFVMIVSAFYFASILFE